MTATTRHNDPVGGQLAQAMMLLEMALDGQVTIGGMAVTDGAIMAAAHSIVQSARSHYTGDPAKASQQSSDLLAAIMAASAIDDARRKE